MLPRAAFLLPLLLAAGSAPGQSTVPTQPATAPAKSGWEVVAEKSFAIAVPRGWRNMLGEPLPPMVLFRQGDGIGVPMADEAGQPLQIGMMVEKYPGTRQSLKEGVDSLLKNALRNPRLKLIGQETVEPLKLSDGTEAMLLITELVKEGNRHSLQMKMLAKDTAGNGWVVSGFLVAGKDSKLPDKDSALAQWLKAHLVSFTLDPQKVDEAKLGQAYEKRSG